VAKKRKISKELPASISGPARDAINKVMVLMDKRDKIMDKAPVKAIDLFR
jgi:hypothetical protein